MFDVIRNMSFIEYLKSYSHILTPFIRYQKAYKNYFSVTLNILRNKYPIKAILRDGKQILLNNYYEVYLTSFGLLNNYRIENNIMTLFGRDLPEIKLQLGKDNGDVYVVFFEEAYKFLPVKGNTVIDIGANIGDSSIYFATKGAKKIIALEPFPKNYESAKKNIDLNNFSNKINVVLGGCSDSTGSIEIDSQQEGAGQSLVASNKGVTIPLFTLENILETNNISSAILKMDCEGCEYNAILSSPDHVLKKFSHIQIEYHYGYKNLKKRLEKCGFSVSVSNPLFLLNLQAHKLMYFGYLYAEQN